MAVLHYMATQYSDSGHISLPVASSSHEKHSFILRLPIEMIKEIFKWHAVISQKSDEDYHSPLLLVCRAWYAIAVECPELWTWIDWNRSTIYDVRRRLVLSKSRPLSLHFESEEDGYGRAPWSTHVASRWHDLHVIFRECFSAAHVPRIQDLSLVVDNIGFPDASRFFTQSLATLPSLHLPFLEILEIAFCSESGSEVVPLDLSTLRAPRLRVLVLGEVQLLNNNGSIGFGPSSGFPLITHLELVDADIESGVAGVLGILRLLPLLEDLVLIHSPTYNSESQVLDEGSVVDGDAEDTPTFCAIHLPKLRILRVTDYADMCTPLFTQLRAPAVVHVFISLTPHWDWQRPPPLEDLTVLFSSAFFLTLRTFFAPSEVTMFYGHELSLSLNFHLDPPPSVLCADKVTTTHSDDNLDVRCTTQVRIEVQRSWRGTAEEEVITKYEDALLRHADAKLAASPDPEPTLTIASHSTKDLFRLAMKLTNCSNVVHLTFAGLPDVDRHGIVPTIPLAEILRFLPPSALPRLASLTLRDLLVSRAAWVGILGFFEARTASDLSRDHGSMVTSLRRLRMECCCSATTVPHMFQQWRKSVGSEVQLIFD